MKTTLFNVVLLLCYQSLPLISAEEECVINELGEQVCFPASSEFSNKCTFEDDDECGYLLIHDTLDGCKNNMEISRSKCPKTCLLCDNFHDGYVHNMYSEEPQQVAPGPDKAATIQRIQQTDDYMFNEIYGDTSVKDTKYNCLNRNALCSFWAAKGECEANPPYMEFQCAPACFSCQKLDFEHRCPFNETAKNTWQPGSLDQMFRRIVVDFSTYEPRVLSAPKEYWSQIQQDQRDGPWIVVLDKFLTEEECQTLIDLGSKKGYEISRDVGSKKFDGTYDAITSKDRTSSNAWCTDDCYEHPVTKRVHERIENITNIPETNYEFLQLLEYEVGEFYGRHHDYIPHHIKRDQGVRILTVFLYLNDVEEGGGTHFSALDITVQPKRGAALIWPSVKNDHPHISDPRTDHQALPVGKGLKYGANAWVHQRDFKTPFTKSCI